MKELIQRVATLKHLLFGKLVNMGTADRAIRLVFGATLVYFGLITQSFADSFFINTVSGLFGLLNIVSAVVRICPAYLVGGLSTCQLNQARTASIDNKEPQVSSVMKRITNSNASNVRSLKRNLLLSITLPVALLLAMFAYLTFEQMKIHKFHIETGAARAVANMALDIESSGNASYADQTMQDVAAIVFHDALGSPVPSIVEKLPNDDATASALLAHITTTPVDQGGTFIIGGKDMVRVTSSIAEDDLHVSVFYDGEMHKINSSGPLLKSLVFTAFLAIWLSGWSAYFVIKRYTNYVSKNSEAIKYRNSHDLLTGLLNRTGLAEIVLDRVESAQHSSPDETDRPFSVLIIDIANFHYFNDALGHKLGDELLKK